MGKRVKPQVLKLIYDSPIVEVIKMPFCGMWFMYTKIE